MYSAVLVDVEHAHKLLNYNWTYRYELKRMLTEYIYVTGVSMNIMYHNDFFF